MHRATRTVLVCMSQHTPLIPIFVELPPFERCREDYLNDDEYRQLQLTLLSNPEAGAVIRGTGGLRKIRFEDKQRGKGKRSGLRMIYYYWIRGYEFWLFMLYNKDEVEDLTPDEKALVKNLLRTELSHRSGAGRRS